MPEAMKAGKLRRKENDYHRIIALFPKTQRMVPNDYRRR